MRAWHILVAAWAGLGLRVAPAGAGEVTGAVHVANEALRQCANTIASLAALTDRRFYRLLFKKGAKLFVRRLKSLLHFPPRICPCSLQMCRRRFSGSRCSLSRRIAPRFAWKATMTTWAGIPRRR